MTKPHIMSDSEWSGWQGSRRGRAEQAQPPAKTPKPSASRLSQCLLKAANEGNAQEVSALLSNGANPNSRERHGQRQSVVLAAIQGGSAQAALEIMRAGGWNAPSQWSKKASQEFDEAIAAGALAGKMLDEAMGRTLVLFLEPCASWSDLSQALDICRGAIPPTATLSVDLMREILARGRWDMARDALEDGELFDEESWSVLNGSLRSSRGLAKESELLALLALATHPKAFESMPQQAAQALFGAAVSRRSASLLEGLLDARLRPSPDWQILASCLHGGLARNAPAKECSAQIPLLVACAAQKDGLSLFKIISSCAAAVEAAKVHKATPWVLERLPLADLLKFHAMGLHLDATDVDGRGLFHVWAAVDAAPRPGWATLGALLPDLLALSDNNGCSPAQAMASSLLASEAQAFLASLARLESREIRKSVGPAPSKSKKEASKNRARL